MDKELTQSIIHQKQLVKRALESNTPDILKRYPIRRSISSIQSYDIIENYNYLDTGLIASLMAIKSNAGSQCFAYYHKYILLKLMERNQPGLDGDSLPESVQILIQSWYRRVIEDFDSNNYTYYSYKNDAFLKDLGVCSQRLIPIGGAWVVEVSGISRRFLMKLSLKGWLCSFFFFLKLRGFRPFYQIHTVFNLTHRFTEKEREKGYYNIALLLEQNRQIKGMFASSWLYDPELGKVSPRLKYLVKTPIANGARCFLVGPSQADTNGALLKSRTRRRLYAQGKYIPTAYIKIWPRRDLIHWARNRYGMNDV